MAQWFKFDFFSLVFNRFLMVFNNKQNKLCHFLINLDNNGYGEQDADAEQDSEKKCEKICWHSGSNLSF